MFAQACYLLRMLDLPVVRDRDRSAELRDALRPELFRALCDPTRLQVLARLALAAEPQTVTEVAGCCGVHLSGVSRHLACLREAGVIRATRSGREVRYALDRVALTRELRGLADAIEACAEWGICAVNTEHDASTTEDRP